MDDCFRILRCVLCSALIAAGVTNVPAFAQESQPGTSESLQEIIVTAQRREQSLQDVPIAVTAITRDEIEANRISTVNDLSAVAPGVTVRPSAGGIQTPFFTIRGQVSEGVVAGSDKEASIYLDGVYISSPRGSIFDLPDVKQLEVLRGPQGTLFGRNATAGAISVTTRDPSGVFGAKVGASLGNYDSNRIRASVDTPDWNGFSALFSFQRNYQRGDIRNIAAGTVWDRTNSPSDYGIARSPTWLGTINSNSYFAALKYETAESFQLVYKYDRNDDSGTPDGTAIVGYDKLAPLLGNVLTALYTGNNVPFDPSMTRPGSVSNGWVVPRQQTAQGHSLTATWQPADHMTVKNIAAYRETNVFSPSPIDGVSSLTFTQSAVQPFALLTAASSVPGFFAAPPATQGAILSGIAAQLQPLASFRFRVLPIASQASSISEQYSDELQFNYSSDKLEATVGALWFHTHEQSGGPIGQENTISFGTFIPANGVIPLNNEGRSFNRATSLAAYTQLEYKFLPQLEAVGGIRMTRDKKESALRYDINVGGVQVVPTTTFTPPDYQKTKPSYSAGLNWTPLSDLLIYGKYANSFVTGGTTYGIAYSPEVAASEEIGAKGDFLNRRLRVNLALYHVVYTHTQQPQGNSSPTSLAICSQSLTPLDGATQAAQLCQYAISTFVIDQGTLRSQGFEAEVSTAPADGVQLGGSLAYSGNKYTYINPVVLAANGGNYNLIDRPAWTGSLYGSYETRPILGRMTALFRADGFYQSKELLNPQAPTSEAVGGYIYTDGSNAASGKVDGYWLLNARALLHHIDFGPSKVEVAIWGKNLTDRKEAAFALVGGPLSTSANFIPPRTYGVDLNVEY